ncbi:MAG TPA: ATPase, T2SS/T4P/T4SS family [Phycisphaerales bacterium]|nr:ATPase, T2SS/T4P/T4SS family [Phycisphaerales bacterium]
MAKHNIDDILNELGLNDDDATRAQRKQSKPIQTPSETPAAQPAAAPADKTYSPLPSAPANQKLYNEPPVSARGRSEEEGSDSTSPPASTGPAAGESLVGPASRTLYDPADEKPVIPAASESAAAAPMNVAGMSLEEILVARNAVTGDKLQTAQQICKQSPNKRLADILIENGADEASVLECVALHSRIPFERIRLDLAASGGFDGTLLQRLTPDFCRAHQVVPIRLEGTRVVIATPDPRRVFLVDEIKERLKVGGVKFVMTPAYDVRGVMEIVGGPKEEEQAVDLSEMLAEVGEGDVQVEAKKAEELNLEKEAAESPVIKYVNHIIHTAVKEGASDIHVEPAEKKVRVRFRIDGELFEMMNPPGSMGAAITSRLKIMANLDISERRLPQDGRIRCMVQGRKLDLRVSTLPNGYGEKTVMRILDTKSINVELEQLGFDENILEVWRKQIEAPHGIVLVTGPTGSGKTTTLYASLRKLDKSSMNISTVEDPVEYHLDGITQTQMHEKIGMTFAKALKALLRQDPDVIMLGEIRDHETATIAVQAALTGHLVLSTLHTNDAPSSITRLVNIGVEPFLASAAVNAVLAQRLIRRLCSHCKTQEPPSESMREYLEMQGMDTDLVWAPKGCEKCRKIGYSGRVGLYELLAVDNQLRDIIARNPSAPEFTRICIERGMVTLQQDGLKKVTKGLTTVDEVLRATKEGH